MATDPTQRAAVRRTVWILAAIAVGAYVLFLSSMLGAK
jgi:hypothetical protein